MADRPSGPKARPVSEIISADLPAAVALSPDLSPLKLADFADTAAVVERMSLVITVDTAMAHLAGALGRPCWVLLPHLGVDWRWMHGRHDSLWYPSVRLYRQPAAGDWASVLRQVSEDLPAFFQQATA
jgi:ADP-heptose:LPS heptosyltransferase